MTDAQLVDAPTLSDIRRAASLTRKKFAGGTGRPRSRKKRCYCGTSTMKRAKARGFACCKLSGLFVGTIQPRRKR